MTRLLGLLVLSQNGAPGPEKTHEAPQSEPHLRTFSLLRIAKSVSLSQSKPCSENKNGGGGENRTRVQRSREASIYKFSLIFPQSPFGPLMMAQTASRDRDYVLAGVSNR